jgi:hypothetical protein
LPQLAGSLAAWRAALRDLALDWPQDWVQDWFSQVPAEQEVFVVFALDGGFAHEGHPDGQGGFGAGFFSPRDWRLSKPTQTPQVTEGEKPRNQASV